MGEELYDSSGQSGDRHQAKGRAEVQIASPLGTRCSCCGASIGSGGDKLGMVVQLGEISW